MMQKILKGLKNENIQDFLNSMTDMVSIKNSEYKIIFENRSHKDIFGDNTGNFCYKGCNKKGMICSLCPVRMALNDGNPHHTLITGLPKENKEEVFDVTVFPVKNRVGQITHTIEITRNKKEDVSDEGKLYKKSDTLRTSHNSEYNATVVIDEDAIIMHANPEFEKLSCYTRAEIEKKASLASFILPSDLNDIAELRRQKHPGAIATTRSYECGFIDKEGKVTDVIMAISSSPKAKRRIVSITNISSHRLAEGILERYTQPTILKMIKKGIDPMTVLPRTIEKIVLFADIISFTSFTERLTIEDVSSLLNAFFGICKEAIAENGGEIAKLTGDCIIAYLPPDKNDDALAAGIKILRGMESLRRSSPEGSPFKVLYNGISISKGKVIEGNIYSDFKINYTILGEAINIAARLQSMTRSTKRFLLFSSNIREGAYRDWNFVSLGRHYLVEGKEKTEVFTIDNNITNMQADEAGMSVDINAYLEMI